MDWFLDCGHLDPVNRRNRNQNRDRESVRWMDCRPLLIHRDVYREVGRVDYLVPPLCLGSVESDLDVMISKLNVKKMKISKFCSILSKFDLNKELKDLRISQRFMSQNEI